MYTQESGHVDCFRTCHTVYVTVWELETWEAAS